MPLCSIFQSSAPRSDLGPLEQDLEGIPEMSFAAVVSQLMAERVKTAPVVYSDDVLEAMESYKTGFIEPVVFDNMFNR